MKKKQIPLFLTILILAALIYYRVSSNELDLITGMIFLAAVWVLVFFLSETVMNILNSSANTRNNIRLLLITVSILFIGLELFLRFGLNRYSTYTERNGIENYLSIYPDSNLSWFYIYEETQEIRWVMPEFIHMRKINSLGLAEQEIAIEKAPNEYRILALGDSFTEGMGTSYNSTWVKVMERTLTAHIPHKKISTMNAGIVGSDVCFEYILLKEKLLSFNPDLVIVAINNTDVHDVIMRGGMERFHPDGSIVPNKKAPGWEWVYGISYIFRHIIHDVFHYNFSLMKESEMESEEDKAVEKISSTLHEFVRLSKENSFDLSFVIHPESVGELESGQYEPCFDRLIAALKHDQDIDFIDLLKYYRGNRIMTENAPDFFWSIDAHYNTKGYEVMGKAIANKIIELNFIDKTSRQST